MTTHFGFGHERYPRSRRTLCAFTLPVGDDILPQPENSVQPTKALWAHVDCESCLAIHLEAVIERTMFLLCPDCMGTGMLTLTERSPEWQKSSAAAGGTFCMRCVNTGLVMAGQGGRYPSGPV